MRPKRARGAAPNLSGATRWIPASGQDKGKVELHVGEAGLPAAPLIGFADSCHIQEGESHWLFSLFHSSWGVLVQFAISIDSLRTPFMETLGDFHGATARWLNERGVAPQPLAEQVPASACAHAPYLVNHLMLSRTGLDAHGWRTGGSGSLLMHEENLLTSRYVAEGGRVPLAVGNSSVHAPRH